MIERQLKSELLALLGEYPIVTILGPRQSGKTTLARSCLPGFKYVNLEAPDTREFARDDPRAFLAEAGAPLIIDEIQRVPELLSYLQVMVDECANVGPSSGASANHTESGGKMATSGSASSTGQYVLTGSHQLELRTAIGQSLAGRTAILTLMPLSITELQSAGFEFDHFSDYIHTGFLPRVYDLDQRPVTAYGNYFQTYVERDVRQLIQLRDASVFERFLRLLAGRVGQVLNFESLGNDTGVDAKTIKQWLSVLEASFIIFRLPPWFENVGKRVIKTPKLYFVEPGLLAWLLDITTADQIKRDPLVGSLFENLVVVEVLKLRAHRGLPSNLYFYRDARGHEVDLLARVGRELHGIEVKSAATLHTRFRQSLDRFDASVAPLGTKTIVYSGRERRNWSDGARAVNFRQLDEMLYPLASDLH